MNGHVTGRGVRESNSVIKGLFEEIMNEDFFPSFMLTLNHRLKMIKDMKKKDPASRHIFLNILEIF